MDSGRHPSHRFQIAPLPACTGLTSGATSVGASLVIAPEAPGGGREGLAAYMQFWDSDTHLTKAESTRPANARSIALEPFPPRRSPGLVLRQLPNDCLT